MTNRTIVIRKQSWLGQSNTKRNIVPIAASSSRAAGFISPVFVVLACTAFSGLFYIYSVNQTAIKGIAIRNAEKEVAQQGKNNESLKIKEAELKSLYRIEEASKQLQMVDAASVKYLEEVPAVAYITATNDRQN
jgi:hypothetical protein